jgi:hypothetical protein
MEKKEMKPQVRAKSPESRRCFIGGSDARTIMGSDDDRPLAGETGRGRAGGPVATSIYSAS